MTMAGTEAMNAHPFPLKMNGKGKHVRRNNGSGTSGSGGTLPEMPQYHYPNNYTVELPPPNPAKVPPAQSAFTKSSTLKKILISKRTSNRPPLGASSEKLDEIKTSQSPQRDSHSVGHNLG